MNINRANKIHTPSLLLQHGYSYTKKIGEGSNGKTYKATNRKTGEIVAIKALKFSDNLKNYELFKREAETLKSIHTPGTPVFYDYITGDGEFTECWLVQEYINGESILEKLEKGEHFDEIKTLTILFEVTKIVQMLQTVYTPPIIHRDIKPSNILIRVTPKNNVNICLIDFGAVANPQRRNVNSTVAGTVGYMAPEQLIGDCTIQSDFYALGATALHMLTGIAPSNFPSDGFTLLFEKQLKQVTGIHKETIELLRKLLAPNPTDRPQNALEIIQFILPTLSKYYKPYIQKRKSLERKIVLSNKFHKLFLYSGYAMGVPAILLILYAITFGITQLLNITAFLSYADIGGTLLISFILLFFIMILFGAIYNQIGFEEELRNQLNQLPNYSINSLAPPEPIQSPKKPLKADKIKEITGEIRAVFSNAFEYTFVIDHITYVSCQSMTNPNDYKVGTKLNIKFDDNNFTIIDVTPIS